MTTLEELVGLLAEKAKSTQAYAAGFELSHAKLGTLKVSARIDRNYRSLLITKCGAPDVSFITAGFVGMAVDPLTDAMGMQRACHRPDLDSKVTCSVKIVDTDAERGLELSQVLA